MAITLIVNGTPYSYPTSGDEPGWGSDATGWAQGVTTVLNDLLGANDILETTVNIANNQTSFVDITGLILNSASVRASEITYSLSRTSTGAPSGHTETGTINVIYDSGNSTWALAQGNILGNAGVLFQITGSGQFQYKSSDIGATGYTGTLHFRAKSLNQ